MTNQSQLREIRIYYVSFPLWHISSAALIQSKSPAMRKVNRTEFLSNKITIRAKENTQQEREAEETIFS